VITLDSNLQARKTGQYTGFNFNSMVKFNGRYLMAGDDGLFELSGTTDNGTAINSWIKTGNLNLGVINKKALRYLYLSYLASNGVSIVVTADENDIDIIPFIASSSRTEARENCSSNVRGVHFSFKISNSDGGTFIIYRLDALVNVLGLGR
jgi:hypothetical protein